MLLNSGTTCWRVEKADRATVIIDMADYFTAAKAAMADARRSIHLLNWAFDPKTLFHPKPGGVGEDEDRIACFLTNLARQRPDLDVRVLCWKATFAVSATQNFFTFKDRAMFAGTPVKFKLDDSLPFGASHHQKMVIIDDRLAFCGGGDIGPDRWDTTDHADDDPRREKRGIWFRVAPRGYESRHELMMAVEGEAAAALGEVFRRRWRRATGEVLSAPSLEEQVARSPWPSCMTPTFADVKVGISRTQSPWKEEAEIRENEALFLASIASAKRLIYLENQYMTSPLLAEALAARLEEPDGPEIILVSTLHCPSWFDQMTMDRTRSVFLRRLTAANKHRRLHAFCPLTRGERIIIVHSKLAIIDDRLLRVGSTNMNNRSCGFDTECDLSIEAVGRGATKVRAGITAARQELIAHWLGTKPAKVAEMEAQVGSVGGAIALLQAGGAPRLTPLTAKKLGAVGGIVAAHHLGDPIGIGDAWRPWRRRGDMQSQLDAQKRRLRSARLPAPERAAVGGDEPERAASGS